MIRIIRVSACLLIVPTLWSCQFANLDRTASAYQPAYQPADLSLEAVEVPLSGVSSHEGDFLSMSPLEKSALEGEEVAAEKEESWRLVLAPYLWAISVDGYASIKGNQARVDEDFSDILDKLSFAIEGRFEAWKGDWGAMIDLSYLRLENDGKLVSGTTTFKTETTTDLVLTYGGAIYRLVDQDVDEDGSGGIKADLLMGLAYTYVDSRLEIKGVDRFSGNETILDPLVGMRSRWMFSEKWGASLEMVLGGFELFNGSELITIATAMVGRKLSEDALLFLGWRTLDLEYDHTGLELDVNINGPILGLEMQF